MDWPRLRDDVRTAATRVGDLLRALPDGNLPLSRVTWSAAELAARRRPWLAPRFARLFLET